MRHSIGSLSKLSGVSIRALHHYDQIGLLQPSEVAESGYRYYDDAAVERLWQILFYRELGFPLAEIGEILSSPSFDRERALTEHRNLLVQKRPVVPSQEEMARMLQEDDLGRTIRFIAEMPAHVCINELVISPVWNRIYLGGADLQRKS